MATTRGPDGKGGETGQKRSRRGGKGLLNRSITSKLTVIAPSTLNRDIPRTTGSLCPECRRGITAEIYEEDGKVLMRKRCPEHGECIDIYYSDAGIFREFQEFALDGVGITNPHTKAERGCPEDCGLCDIHLSHPGIVNIDLTNRCNMNCPICFANANASGFIYEPEFEEVVGMLRMLRDLQPVPVQAVQFAGGEPTIYPRFLDVLRAAREIGIPQLQVATNGVEFAKDPEFVQRCSDAGLHTVYLQFDTFKEENIVKIRNRPGLLREKLQAIENCAKVRPQPLTVCLVPVIVRGVNDDEIGKLIDFGLQKSDTVRAVNFQPVSFSGRIDHEERIRGRYTQADIIRDSVEQTGFLEREDWYPVPVAAAISEVVSMFHGEPKLAFTCHPACGIGCYVFVGEDGKKCGVSRFIDVEGLYEEALTIAGELKGVDYFQKIRVAVRMMKLLRHVDKARMPKGMNVRRFIRDVIIRGDKESVGNLQWKSLFLGAMHFMDLYNYDIERVKRCVVHYATPDGRLIPFCAYNTGPTFREEVERRHAISFEEYRERRERPSGEA